MNEPYKYQRVLDLAPSRANALEFCLGSLQETREGNVNDSIEQYGWQGKIAYVHFRNVRGKVPRYQEVFVDEGDLAMLRAIRTLRNVGYDGVIIPDHAGDHLRRTLARGDGVRAGPRGPGDSAFGSTPGPHALLAPSGVPPTRMRERATELPPSTSGPERTALHTGGATPQRERRRCTRVVQASPRAANTQIPLP